MKNIQISKQEKAYYASVASNIVKFSTSVPFEASYSYAKQYTLTANTTIIPKKKDAIVGATTVYRIIGDGTSVVTFTGFKRKNTSKLFDNNGDAVNIVEFFYDGYDYWLNIFQETAVIADTIAPILQSITVEEANKNKMIFTYNEILDTNFSIVTNAFTLSGGKTVSSGTYSGNTLTLTLSAPYATGDTITAAYAGTFIRDQAGNLAAQYGARAVTNNITT